MLIQGQGLAKQEAPNVAGADEELAGAPGRSPLFSAEALAHAQARKSNFDAVLLATPPTTRFISLFLAGSIISAALFVCVVPFDQSEFVSGWAVPQSGIARVSAQNSGNVVSVFKLEGGNVQQGESLVTIRRGQDTSLGDATELAMQRLDEEEV